MANPRQRRKARSSTHRPVSHSKRAKRLQKKMPAICGPKALQDAWDPCKTVRQNYLALGLRHDLNPISSGGSEVNLSSTIERRSHPTASFGIDGSRTSDSDETAIRPALPKGFGRIVRDSSGNVVLVELPSDEDAGHASERELVDVPVVMTKSELRIWADDRREKGEGSGNMKDMVVQDLEDLASSAIVRERHTSSGERAYLERLVNKYGDELDKMARDRRLNPAQRTANELKRAIAKAGGLVALHNGTATRVTG